MEDEDFQERESEEGWTEVLRKEYLLFKVQKRVHNM